MNFWALISTIRAGARPCLMNSIIKRWDMKEYVV